MASNYTTNYGLCQWEATDQFVRSEFNQDNQKIDAALAGKLGRWQLIRNIPFSGELNCTVDLSDIQWEEWEKVFFLYDFPLPITGTEREVTIWGHLNSRELDAYCTCDSSLFFKVPTYPILLIFLPFHDANRKIQAICLSGNSGLSFGEGTFSQLENMYFYRGNGTNQWLPGGSGTTMELWGVK